MQTSHVSRRKRQDGEVIDDLNELRKSLQLKDVLYREIIGSLLYLANATRPDIIYTVNVLSRYQIDPTVREWQWWQEFWDI